MRPVSELARERETLRYDASLLASAVIAEDGPLPPSSTLTSSGDTILTAFAQLITLRLCVGRALISLFDHKYQYVVAEATPSSPLAARAKYDGPGDGFWLCGTAIPRSFGICEHVFDLADHELAGGSNPEHLPLFVIPDIHQEPQFRNRSACQSHPSHRFYAGVPIRSPRGIDIGVLCVYDDSPRNGLDPICARVMHDVSKSLTEYWESKRSRAALSRNQRMVRGIGSFIEGKTTISDWQNSHGGLSFDNIPGLEGALNANQQVLQHRQSIDLGSTKSPTYPTDIPTRPAPVPVQNSAAETTKNNPSFVVETSASRDSIPVRSNDSVSSISASFSAPSAPTKSTHIKLIFSRAANVIRESIQVEGVVFVDAIVKSFGGFHARENSISADESGASGHGDSASEGDAVRAGEAALESADDAHCPILGFSTSNLSTIDQEPTSSYKLMVPERLLLRLLRRYPEGKIFSFDEHGTVQLSDSSSDSGHTVSAPASTSRRRVPRPFSKQNEAKAIIETFPGARNVALVPIWDAQKQRWSAAGFVYTMDPLRQFSVEGELSYLRGFSSIIMAEVVRTETTIADHAKGDALSSLSHELRSPLHGIVLGTELLADTHLDAYQGNVLHTVETCGRTLLDSIDHLLDYSKINNFLKKSSRPKANNVARGLRQNKAATVEAGMMSLASDIQLDVLVEEVIESLCLGHNYHHLSIAQWEQGTPSVYEDVNALRRLDSMRATENLERGSTRLPFDDVSIYIDIEPKDSWLFHGQPGAIRRILMNIFGNALKYTSRGTIKVSLQQELLPGSERHSRRIIRLVVEDTGKGISEDYLQNHLFHAFSQENSLDPGTGLGLSLVKQITSSLGGMIRVDSRVDVGTTVSICFPMSPGTTSLTETVIPGGNEFAERVEQLKGLRVLLYGIGDSPDSKTPSAGHETRMDELMLRKTCREWLQMDVISSLDWFQFAPDIILCSETSLDRLLEERQTRDLPPTVTICQNVLRARDLAHSFAASGKRGVFEFVTQPTGPRKLSKIVLLCFNRWLDAQPDLSIGGSLWHSPSVVPQNNPFDVLPSPGIVEPNTATQQPFPASLSREETLKPDNIPISHPSPTGSPNARHSTPTPRQPQLLRTMSYSQPQEVSRNMFLIVDDNAINRTILESYLKKLEHPFVSATNGKEAYDAYIGTPGRFHCILMDISMPIMDGFESSRLIRKFERNGQLHPVIIFALTGLASTDAQQEALASGIDLFLTKPVRLKELSLILSQHRVS